MRQRGVLARKMEAPFGFDNVRIQMRLLSWLKERERAARKFILVPHTFDAPTSNSAFTCG